MNRLLIAVLVVCMIAFCTAAYAQGKITVDPNTPEARASADRETVDERIAQKVTYEAEGKSVLSILDDLSEMTGVTLKAGYNNSDWQVRDRKMNIFAKDVPLGHLMNSIARVMMFKWSINEDADPPTYRLYMDRRTLVSAETQYLRQEQRIAQELAERRETTLNSFSSMGQLSEEELARLKVDQPLLYVFTVSGVAEPMGRFLNAAPAVAEALATGQAMDFSASELSADGQQGLIGAVQAWGQLECKMSGYERDLASVQDMIGGMGDVSVSINADLDSERDRDEAGDAILGVMRGKLVDRKTRHTRSFEIPLLDWEHPLSKLIGEAAVVALEQGRPMEEGSPEFEDRMRDAMASEFKTEDKGEPVLEHPEADQDPELQRTVKMGDAGSFLNSIQRELARASELPVVSDSFGRIPGALREHGEMKLLELLDKIADGYRYNWDKHDGVLEFRCRDWYVHRMAQIPEAWLEEWRTALKEEGTLDIDHLSQIAMLTIEQLNVNFRTDEVLARCVVSSRRDMLRFYAALNDQQKAMLSSESGLDLAYLSAEQWVYAQSLISRRSPTHLAAPDVRLAAYLTREPYKEKAYSYTLTVTSTDDVDPLQLTLYTPVYKEPRGK